MPRTAPKSTQHTSLIEMWEHRGSFTCFTGSLQFTRGLRVAAFGCKHLKILWTMLYLRVGPLSLSIAFCAPKGHAGMHSSFHARIVCCQLFIFSCWLSHHAAQLSMGYPLVSRNVANNLPEFEGCWIWVVDRALRSIELRKEWRPRCIRNISHILETVKELILHFSTLSYRSNGQFCFCHNKMCSASQASPNSPRLCIRYTTFLGQSIFS